MPPQLCAQIFFGLFHSFYWPFSSSVLILTWTLTCFDPFNNPSDLQNYCCIHVWLPLMAKKSFYEMRNVKREPQILLYSLPSYLFWTSENQHSSDPWFLIVFFAFSQFSPQTTCYTQQLEKSGERKKWRRKVLVSLYHFTINFIWFQQQELPETNQSLKLF